ncbi:40S ribosomal protein S10-like [Anopheles maculipalpis]|uniref:40S ribosomal protein S10-like n=1 Tax=Anopheles maculipalpis TaxID=1496333 RepID=UPI002159B0CA|nr:40S ribosomal protein S10-like [Anopheles maculipalpis]
MFMPKEHRLAIYKLLFAEGVMVAEKHHDRKKMHRELKLIPNLHIIKTMTSLVSKQYVKECYCWNHYYWTLTNEGIIYLRDYLHLAPQLVPTTLIARPRLVPNAVSFDQKDRGVASARPAEDRGVYRRLERPATSIWNKRDDAGVGSNDLVFRGGFGRGNRNDNK